jgi:hypothetical protein
VEHIGPPQVGGGQGRALFAPNPLDCETARSSHTARVCSGRRPLVLRIIHQKSPRPFRPYTELTRQPCSVKIGELYRWLSARFFLKSITLLRVGHFYFALTCFHYLLVIQKCPW